MTEYANTTDSVKTVENEAASAKYWHDMYVATSQMAQDYAAKVGADIKRLENELQVSDQSGYEKGFVEGAQHQMKSSVDKAVNRMAQPEQEPVAWEQFHEHLVERNFCHRCGKRLHDALGPVSLHTCCPPQGRTFDDYGNKIV